MLRNKIYAGYVENEGWNVSLRKAKHEPLVSLETFERVQDRLIRGTAKAPIRKDMSALFPLRGFVTCCECERPLTGSRSRSKSGKRHAYYYCRNDNCSAFRKTIRKADIEGAFEALIKSLTPSEDMFAFAKALFEDLWNQRAANAHEASARVVTDIAALDKDIELLLDRVVDATRPSVIAALEKRIARLEESKLALEEKRLRMHKPYRPFRENFEHAMELLENPGKLWFTDDPNDRRRLLRMVFPERLAWCLDGGFRTPQKAQPFAVLGGFSDESFVVARRGRFELPTPRFVVWCSIQLSYRRRFHGMCGPSDGP